MTEYCHRGIVSSYKERDMKMKKITERTPRSIRYQGETPIAILSLSAFSAIAIYQPDEFDVGTCEFVVADLNNRNELIKPRCVTTHFDRNGVSYFYRYGRKCFLDEFIRILRVSPD